MERVLVDANDHPDDGGLDEAEVHLNTGARVAIENLHYARDADVCQKLADRFGVTASFVWAGPGSPKCIFARKCAANRNE